MELTLSEKREVIAEAQRLYAEAFEYVNTPSHGYCFHGQYVGGCGIDWMCGACEHGEDSEWDYLEGSRRYEVALGSFKAKRDHAWREEAFERYFRDEVSKEALKAEATALGIFVHWLQ